jgi:hypothetical protein
MDELTRLTQRLYRLHSRTELRTNIERRTNHVHCSPAGPFVVGPANLVL